MKKLKERIIPLEALILSLSSTTKFNPVTITSHARIKEDKRQISLKNLQGKPKISKTRSLSQALLWRIPLSKICFLVQIMYRIHTFFNLTRIGQIIVSKRTRFKAIYDDSDGMPHYYSFINKVVLLHPFEVQLRWI